MNDDAEALAAFVYELGLLKRIRRSGWWHAGVRDPESVAEHTMRVAQLAAIIAAEEGANPERAAFLAIWHDSQETRARVTSHRQSSHTSPSPALGRSRQIRPPACLNQPGRWFAARLRSSSRGRRLRLCVPRTQTGWTCCSKPLSTARSAFVEWTAGSTRHETGSRPKQVAGLRRLPSPSRRWHGATAEAALDRPFARRRSTTWAVAGTPTPASWMPSPSRRRSPGGDVHRLPRSQPDRRPHLVGRLHREIRRPLPGLALHLRRRGGPGRDVRDQPADVGQALRARYCGEARNWGTIIAYAAPNFRPAAAAASTNRIAASSPHTTSSSAASVAA